MSNIAAGGQTRGQATRARGGPPCETCGGHSCRCLFGAADADPNAFRSSYQQSFQAHSPSRVPRRDEHRPRAEFNFGAQPFEAVSTSQADYRAHGPGAAARPARPPAGDPGLISGGSTQRVLTSEAHSSFSPKGVAVRESYAPRVSHSSQLPFEGTSTNMADYRAHVGVKPSTPFKEKPTVSSAREDRDFQSQAAMAFVAHGIQRRQPLSPPNRHTGARVPFEGQTTNAADYRGVAAPPAQSCAPKQSHQAAEENRDFRTLHQVDFDAKGYAKRESFKPSPDRSAANIRFDGTSTTRADYTGAQGQRAQLVRPAIGLTDTIGVAIGSKETRPFVTEARGQFQPKGVAVRESYAPRVSHSSQLPFEATSTNMADYRAHVGVKPSTPFKARPTVSIGREDRDFETTTAGSYVAHGDQRRQAFSPPQRHTTEKVPFEGTSTTNADYTWHEQKQQ